MHTLISDLQKSVTVLNTWMHLCALEVAKIQKHVFILN